jgi:3-dehydroshikimate dehydratase
MQWKLCLCAAAAAAAACGGNDDDRDRAPPSSDPRTALVVSSAADDGTEGTLRWAILKSNAEPGRFRIVLVPQGGASLVIRPTSQLPSIVGPARIEGPWTGTGTPRAVVDGSALLDLTVLKGPGIPAACPGEVAGQFGPNTRSIRNAGLQVVDSHDVEFTGFEVRNFCTGIMSLRSRNNRIHGMRIASNLGAAGVLITGDDGTAAGGFTAGTSINNVLENNVFINNTDAVDVARGSNGTVIRDNSFVIDAQGTPSSGIEILSSDNAVLEDNTISGYATALQLGGNGHSFSRNLLVNNAIAVQMGGTGYRFTANVIRNNRTGVMQTAGGTKLNTLSQNRIYANGKDISACGPLNGQNTVPDSGVCLDKEWLTSRINFSLNGFAPSIANDAGAACADGFPDCTAPQNYPVLGSSVWLSSGYRVGGTLASRPNEKFVIEFFASHTSGIDGLGEGEVYLGQAEVTTDAAGNASFLFATGTTDPLRDGTRNVYFTATATRVSNGQTSEFSRPQLVAGP